MVYEILMGRHLKLVEDLKELEHKYRMAVFLDSDNIEELKNYITCLENELFDTRMQLFEHLKEQLPILREDNIKRNAKR